MMRFAVILFLTFGTIYDANTARNATKVIASNHQSKSDKNNVCGYRNVFEFSEGFWNDKAQNGEFPWMVAVLVQNVYKCGGSLIHPSAVVTAAHCILSKNTYTVRAGGWYSSFGNQNFNPVQDKHVADYIIHDQYHKGGLFNDIALLFLVEPFKITFEVNIVCLPPQNYNFNLERCIVSGRGNHTSSKTNTAIILNRIELKIVPKHICLMKLREANRRPDFNLHESFLCAGGERGKDTCKGQGGSPLVCPIPNTEHRYYQAGIVSWGIGCGDSIPAVYVNVALFRNWIEKKLETKGISKSYFVAA